MKKVSQSGKNLHIGVLGTGFMGKMRSHAYSVIGTIFEDLEIVPNLYAVASLDEQNIGGFAKRFNYQYQSDDWLELIDDPDIDVITICLPEHLHRETAVAALQARKHVFCEKALAHTLEDCQSMVATAEASPKISMIGFNYRFLPAIQFARGLIQNNIIGDLYFVDCRYFQESGHDPNRPAEEVTYAYGDTPLGSAKGLGSHVADSLRFLMGDFLSVQAVFKTFVPTRKTRSGDNYPVKTDDFATMTVEFVNGAVGTLSTSKVAAGRKNQFRVEINGSKGSLIYDVEEPNYLHIYLDDAPSVDLRGFSRINVTEKCHPLMKYWWPPAHNLGWEHSHINEIYHFVKSIQENKPVSPLGGSFQDGLEAVRLIESAFRASNEGRKILL